MRAPINFLSATLLAAFLLFFTDKTSAIIHSELP